MLLVREKSGISLSDSRALEVQPTDPKPREESTLLCTDPAEAGASFLAWSLRECWQAPEVLPRMVSTNSWETSSVGCFWPPGLWFWHFQRSLIMLGWGEAAGEDRKSASYWVSSALGKSFISIPGQLITLGDQDAGPSWGSSGVYVQPLKAEAHSPHWARPPPSPTALKLCEYPPPQRRHTAKLSLKDPRKWPWNLQISRQTAITRHLVWYHTNLWVVFPMWLH